MGDLVEMAVVEAGWSLILSLLYHFAQARYMTERRSKAQHHNHKQSVVLPCPILAEDEMAYLGARKT